MNNMLMCTDANNAAARSTEMLLQAAQFNPSMARSSVTLARFQKCV